MEKPSSHLSSQAYAMGMLKGLEEIWKTEKLCDVTLVVDGDIFHVHRVVLASVSQYFMAMFTGGILESRKEVIELNGVTATGLKACLECVYSGELDLSLENVSDILGTANHLQVGIFVHLILCSYRVYTHIYL